ncbi:MAG: phosphate-starvation-inducible PsiE family protein [Microthrixaceae bacterium]
MRIEEEPSRRIAVLGDQLIMYVEMAIYAVVSAILVLGAVALLFDSIVSFFDDLEDGALWASTQMLSVLLLVFVFVELLGAVRSTIRQRRLVAEPFLLVGIIACIKEIVLVGGAERVEGARFPVFRDAMVEISVLAVVVLLLSIATVLLRRRKDTVGDVAVGVEPVDAEPAG